MSVRVSRFFREVSRTERIIYLDMLKYTFIFSCLLLLIASCGTDVTQEDYTQPVIKSDKVQSQDSIVTEEPAEVLTGFPRFYFVKDSLGFELENVEVLANTYSKEKIYFNQLEKDTAYFIILDFLKEIRIAPEDDKALYEYNEVKESEIAKYYRRYGILIESSEGEYYCVPDYSYLAKLFDGDLNPELDIYKDFLVVRNRHIFDDGGLMISWMELASQILETEDFYHDLMEPGYKQDVLLNYSWLVNPMFYGSENSYIVDVYNDSIVGLLPEVQEAYDMIMLDPIHNSGNLFTTHLENLKLANFKPRGKDMHFMTDEEIKEFLDFK